MNGSDELVPYATVLSSGEIGLLMSREQALTVLALLGHCLMHPLHEEAIDTHPIYQALRYGGLHGTKARDEGYSVHHAGGEETEHLMVLKK